MFVYNKVYIYVAKNNNKETGSQLTPKLPARPEGKQLVYLGGLVVTGFTAFFTQLARIYWLSTNNIVFS